LSSNIESETDEEVAEQSQLDELPALEAGAFFLASRLAKFVAYGAAAAGAVGLGYLAYRSNPDLMLLWVGAYALYFGATFLGYRWLARFVGSRLEERARMRRQERIESLTNTAVGASAIPVAASVADPTADMRPRSPSTLLASTLPSADDSGFE
jgi:hypothetical protein